MRKPLLCVVLMATLSAGGLRTNAEIGGYPEAAPSLDAPSDAAITLRDFACSCLGKRLVTVEYGMGNGQQQKCMVSFEVRGGAISQIRWQVIAY